MKQQKETVGFNEGGRPRKTGVSENPAKPGTLHEAGIGKRRQECASKWGEQCA
jgi:hypothetical protein